MRIDSTRARQDYIKLWTINNAISKTKRTIIRADKISGANCDETFDRTRSTHDIDSPYSFEKSAAFRR